MVTHSMDNILNMQYYTANSHVDAVAHSPPLRKRRCMNKEVTSYFTIGNFLLFFKPRHFVFPFRRAFCEPSPSLLLDLEASRSSTNSRNFDIRFRIYCILKSAAKRCLLSNNSIYVGVESWHLCRRHKVTSNIVRLVIVFSHRVNFRQMKT